jgi:hypothetical protein
MWRLEVINTIHTANLSVQRKYMFITKFLDRKEARLAAMCVFTTFTASTYVDLIEELELTYRGHNRCFDFVRTKLINGNKLLVQTLWRLLCAFIGRKIKVVVDRSRLVPAVIFPPFIKPLDLRSPRSSGLSAASNTWWPPR